MRTKAVALALLSVSLVEEAFAQIAVPPVTVTAPAPSLTVPSVTDAREQIDKTPGGVEIVPAEQYRDGRATTLKDVLDYVPGVFIQSKYGQEDSKLSIRGSGLSRNFHLRGVRLLQDGTPINQADGSGDFHEIDPLAQQYVEVFKGANALRYGAMTLGGAINFVSPTGRSNPGFLARVYGGSYDTLGEQLAAGFSEGPWDAWLTLTNLHSNGFRQHTTQDLTRFNGNVGAQVGSNVETRFFLSGNYIKNQIPGSLTQQQFWTDPRQGPAANIVLNTRRDIEFVPLRQYHGGECRRRRHHPAGLREVEVPVPPADLRRHRQRPARLGRHRPVQGQPPGRRLPRRLHPGRELLRRHQPQQAVRQRLRPAGGADQRRDGEVRQRRGLWRELVLRGPRAVVRHRPAAQLGEPRARRQFPGQRQRFRRAQLLRGEPQDRRAVGAAQGPAGLRQCLARLGAADLVGAQPQRHAGLRQPRAADLMDGRDRQPRQAGRPRRLGPLALPFVGQERAAAPGRAGLRRLGDRHQHRRTRSTRASSSASPAPSWRA